LRSPQRAEEPGPQGSTLAHMASSPRRSALALWLFQL